MSTQIDEPGTKGPYTVAGEVARLIEHHPGETPTGLYRRYMDRFAEFGTDNNYAKSMIRQNLVSMEEVGLVRREKGPNKTAPQQWFWVGGDNATTTSSEAEDVLTPAEAAYPGRVANAPVWQPPRYEIRADPCEPELTDAVAEAVADLVTPTQPDDAWRRVAAAVEAAPEVAEDALICQVDLTFSVGHTTLSFSHEGGWHERIALRLERFLLAATAEGE